jgi:hypothetical protein
MMKSFIGEIFEKIISQAFELKTSKIESNNKIIEPNIYLKIDEKIAVKSLLCSEFSSHL